MDGDKVATLATASGVTVLGLHMPTIVAGILAAAVVGGAGYASYRIGKAMMKRFSELKGSEKAQPVKTEQALA